MGGGGMGKTGRRQVEGKIRLIQKVVQTFAH